MALRPPSLAIAAPAVSVSIFRQIYFNPQRHGAQTNADATRALGKLCGRAVQLDPTALGDPFLLQEAFDNISLSDAKKTFGEQFASAVAAAPLGSWEGPISSGYGVHLIYAEQRTADRVPALNEVRDQVLRENLEARRKQTTDNF